MAKSLIKILIFAGLNITALDNAMAELPEILRLEEIVKTDKFILIAKNKQDGYCMAQSDLIGLKRCIFPAGFSVYNQLSDFSGISKNTYDELLAESSHILPPFCIHTHSPDNLTNCGFELPGDQKLGIAFKIHNDLSYIRGIIISADKFELLTKRSTSTAVVDPAPKNSEADIPEDTQKVQKSKLEILITGIACRLLVGYADISAGLSSASKYVKNLLGLVSEPKPDTLVILAKDKDDNNSMARISINQNANPAPVITRISDDLYSRIQENSVNLFADSFKDIKGFIMIGQNLESLIADDEINNLTSSR